MVKQLIPSNISISTVGFNPKFVWVNNYNHPAYFKYFFYLPKGIVPGRYLYFLAYKFYIDLASEKNNPRSFKLDCCYRVDGDKEHKLGDFNDLENVIYFEVHKTLSESIYGLLNVKCGSLAYDTSHSCYRLCKKERKEISFYLEDPVDLHNHSKNFDNSKNNVLLVKSMDRARYVEAPSSNGVFYVFHTSLLSFDKDGQGLNNPYRLSDLLEVKIGSIAILSCMPVWILEVVGPLATTTINIAKALPENIVCRRQIVYQSSSNDYNSHGIGAYFCDVHPVKPNDPFDWPDQFVASSPLFLPYVQTKPVQKKEKMRAVVYQEELPGPSSRYNNPAPQHKPQTPDYSSIVSKSVQAVQSQIVDSNKPLFEDIRSIKDLLKSEFTEVQTAVKAITAEMASLNKRYEKLEAIVTNINKTFPERYRQRSVSRESKKDVPTLLDNASKSDTSSTKKKKGG